MEPGLCRGQTGQDEGKSALCPCQRPRENKHRKATEQEYPGVGQGAAGPSVRQRRQQHRHQGEGAHPPQPASGTNGFPGRALHATIVGSPALARSGGVV